MRGGFQGWKKIINYYFRGYQDKRTQHTLRHHVMAQQTTTSKPNLDTTHSTTSTPSPPIRFHPCTPLSVIFLSKNLDICIVFLSLKSILFSASLARNYYLIYSDSARYIILAEFPIVANPISFLTAAPTSRPFIKNFYWNHKGMTKFYVVSKEESILLFLPLPRTLTSSFPFLSPSPPSSCICIVPSLFLMYFQRN